MKQEHVGPLFVSTVFLGLDHNISTLIDPAAEPLLFETMIFDELQDNYQTRCTTWDQAEFMHQAAVAIANERWEASKILLEKSKWPGCSSS